VVGVELADEAVRLADLHAARQRTVAVLGHEQSGIPPEAAELLDVLEISMIGTGASLNVAVAGSLVLFRLAGFLWHAHYGQLTADSVGLGPQLVRSLRCRAGRRQPESTILVVLATNETLWTIPKLPNALLILVPRRAAAGESGGPVHHAEQMVAGAVMRGAA
jgi:SpoU rRNA Methylase family